MRHIANAQYPTGIAQDDFFCHLAGPVAPTGKAIVQWVRCINAIKRQHHLNLATLAAVILLVPYLEQDWVVHLIGLLMPAEVLALDSLFAGCFLRGRNSGHL